MNDLTNPAASVESDGIGRDGYHAFHYGKREPAWYTFLLLDVIRYGRPGNLLDIGCGVGAFLELASQWGMEVAGVDASAEAVALAKQRFPSLAITHHLLSGRLPHADGSFDNAVLNQVIEHLPPAILKNTLSESFRVLKPGGRIFIYSPGKANRAEVEGDPTHCNPQYPSELRGLLRESGFEMVAEPNSPRLLGRAPLLHRIVSRIARSYWEDWLSATANAIAQRPA